MRRIKGILAGQTTILQLFMLLSLMIIGAVLFSAAGLFITRILYHTSTDLYRNPDALRWIQLFSTIGTFLFPSLAMAWLCSKKPSEYLFTDHPIQWNLVLPVFISLLLFSPFITLTGVVNKWLELPAFMKPIEDWMKTQENTAEQITNLLLSGTDIFTFFSNLIVIAVAAAITEEFLFRGTLFRIFERWSRNHHLVIWGVAILFSAFHMQFYGFIPRMLLGAYFGYLVYWSKSIWIPVLAHFTNNALSVIGLTNSHLKENEYISGDVAMEHLPAFSLFCLVTLFFFFLTVRQIHKRCH